MHSSGKATRNPPGDQLERAILQMTAGSPLLKFAKAGNPGFRPYQLSSDLLALTWQTKKTGVKTSIAIKDMKEIRYGQRTDKFKKKINRPDLENLSFSIMHMEKGQLESLDLVCKDEAEFQMWTGTLATLIEGKTDLTQYLLAVQKRQLEAAQRGEGLDGSDARKARMALKHSKVGAFKETEADVYAFGWGEWGQNGIGLPSAQGGGADLDVCPTPKLLESLLGKHVVALAQGWSHTVVALESGELLQCGNRVGTGLAEDYVVPTPTPLSHVSEKLSIVSLAAGAFHTAALTERGHVLTWGGNVAGQCGHGDRRDVKEPRFVEALRQPSHESDSGVFVVSLVCGSSFTAVLSDEGGVYTFGAGQHGVLGHNDTVDRDVPTRVQDLAGTDVQRLAAGDCHMFACTLRETYAWGANSSSQLGLGGSEDDQHRPHVVEALRGLEVREIAAGAVHSCALVRQGNQNLSRDVLYTWGSNACGQLGQGKKNKLVRPTPVPEIRFSSALAGSAGAASATTPHHATHASAAENNQLMEIKCGSFHTLLRTAGGEVYASGSNVYGQCGLPTLSSSSAAAASSMVLSKAGTATAASQVDEFRCIDFIKDKQARALVAGGENSAVLTKRAWVEDHEAADCMACKSVFTFVNRKHHCRNCGGIFCGSCSSKKIAILRIQVTEPVRVCNSCYTMLGGR